MTPPQPREIFEFVQNGLVLFWRDAEDPPSGEELKKLNPKDEFSAGAFGYVRFGNDTLWAFAVTHEKLVTDDKRKRLERSVFAQLVNAVAKICIESKPENGSQEIFTPPPPGIVVP